MPLPRKRPAVSRPTVLFVVPSLAILVSLLSVLWGAEDGPVLAAQLWGGPTDSTQGFFGRVRLLQESSSVVTPVPGERVTVEAGQGEHRFRREVTTGPDGWAELSLPRHVEHPLSLALVARGQRVASGAPTLNTERWSRAASSHGPLAAHGDSALRASLRIDSCVLSVPFTSQAVLKAWVEGAPAASARFQLRGESVEVLGAAEGRLDQAGEARFALRPGHHVATLSVRLNGAGKELAFEQTLPVVPGSMAMAVTERGIVVRSPVERDTAWFTFVTERERLVGGRLELVSTVVGAEGLIPRDLVPERTGLYLVLSSEADGRSPSSVGYPLDGQDNTFEAWDGYLLDGFPEVRARREHRARRLRWTLGGYAALSGVLTLVLFWIQVKRSELQLDRGLLRVGAEPGSRQRSSVPLVVAVVCIFAAFSAVVLWIVAR